MLIYSQPKLIAPEAPPTASTTVCDVILCLWHAQTNHAVEYAPATHFPLLKSLLAYVAVTLEWIDIVNSYRFP